MTRTPLRPFISTYPLYVMFTRARAITRTHIVTFYLCVRTFSSKKNEGGGQRELETTDRVQERARPNHDAPHVTDDSRQL